MNVDLAILLVSAAGGAALLLFTSGRAGGYLVQPRTIKGVPVGPSPTPNGPTPGPTPKPTPTPKPKPEPNPPSPKPPNDWPVPNGSDNGTPQGPPPCKYDMLVLALLDQYAVELSPYATGRAKAPWPEVTDGKYAKGMSELYAERMDSPGYYITAAVLKTLLAQNADPSIFASGDFEYPGCILPDAAFADGTPLRNLVSAWQAGSDEPLPGDSNIDA